MTDGATVTAADISRLTGLGRAAVSNWRRRYDDFPEPVGGTAGSPRFSLQEVQAWLIARGKIQGVAAEDLLWQRLRTAVDEIWLGSVIANAGAFLVMLRRTPQAWERLAELPDEELTARLADTVSRHTGDLPGSGVERHTDDSAGLARQIARQAAADGPADTFESLHRRYVAHDRRVACTAPQAADLMAALAGIGSGDTVLDPACGTGELLRAALERGAARIVGQERDEAIARIAAIRQVLHDRPAEIAIGDALRADAFGGLRADVVLCTPPYAARNWGHAELTHDPRWVYGLPAKGESELAWVQHALARTRPGGRALVLMPAAAAARRSGRRIRARLLREGALRGVIALPAGSASASSMPPHLWLLRAPGPDGPPPSHVFMLDASDPDAWPRIADRVRCRWREFLNDPGEFGAGIAEEGRAVPLVDLLDEDVDLTPTRHLPKCGGRPGEGFAELGDRLERSVSSLARTVSETPRLTVAEPDLPFATLGELVKAGAVALLQAATKMELGQGPVPVLTSQDLSAGRAATGRAPRREGLIPLQAGDVVLPVVTRSGSVRVVREAGAVLGPHLYLVRTDPARFDPDFIAGCLRAAGREAARRSQTSASRVDVRRARIPRLALPEQVAYGAAFRRLEEVESGVRAIVADADAMVQVGLEGLSAGALRPEG